MKFLDQAKIYLTSGSGGPGCVSFRREKNVEFGGPDGGNGGKGGEVYFVADNRLNTLIDFRYQQHYKAQNGLHGMGKNRSGAKGEDCIIRVPVGTQLLDEDQETVLMDFTREGQKIKFLRGGDGGFGNAHYKSAVNQAPRRSTPGWPGQEQAVWLRLKLIADAGLVGLPNAGKSTFLAAASNAKPKIADYPFTTLHPNLGVVKVGDIDFVLADIPGLIEGAHEGHGLGDRFLGHVERTSILLHIIDCTQDDVVAAYNTIRHELSEYSPALAEKAEIIALNKSDAMGEELTEMQRQALSDATGKEIHTISAVAGTNVRDILFKLGVVVRDSKQSRSDEERRKNEEYLSYYGETLDEEYFGEIEDEDDTDDE